MRESSVATKRLLLGDCLAQLRNLPDASVDSIVTDPPYGLGFMGKKWDALPPGQDVFEECLRVLKPGGHLLAFGGSRTYHRLAVAVEDAGFEIRDQIMWLYGSGFPKSQNIGKEIDKHNGDPNRLWRFTAWMRTTQLTAAQINRITGTEMGGHYLTAKSQPAIPTPHLWGLLRPHCGEVPVWVDELVDRIAAEREVVGRSTNGIAGGSKEFTSGNENSAGFNLEYDITAPATEEAQKWDGWGTALKPAHEPIVVARKPLDGTVAGNVVKHGTGAINVDGCRVGSETIRQHGRNANSKQAQMPQNEYKPNKSWQGRFPANVIHDGSDEATADMGEASRYFYCAKASKRDRTEGGEVENKHPTVKPTELMRYLCRLVTPPGGIVLDPFMGSGSTGKAAVMEGFEFIGIEADPESVEVARQRIDCAEVEAESEPSEPDLFDAESA
jgi:DNA modification methylase